LAVPSPETAGNGEIRTNVFRAPIKGGIDSVITKSPLIILVRRTAFSEVTILYRKPLISRERLPIRIQSIMLPMKKPNQLLESGGGLHRSTILSRKKNSTGDSKMLGMLGIWQYGRPDSELHLKDLMPIDNM